MRHKNQRDAQGQRNRFHFPTLSSAGCWFGIKWRQDHLDTIFTTFSKSLICLRINLSIDNRQWDTTLTQSILHQILNEWKQYPGEQAQKQVKALGIFLGLKHKWNQIRWNTRWHWVSTQTQGSHRSNIQISLTTTILNVIAWATGVSACLVSQASLIWVWNEAFLTVFVSLVHRSFSSDEFCIEARWLGSQKHCCRITSELWNRAESGSDKEWNDSLDEEIWEK